MAKPVLTPEAAYMLAVSIQSAGGAVDPRLVAVIGRHPVLALYYLESLKPVPMDEIEFFATLIEAVCQGCTDEEKEEYRIFVSRYITTIEEYALGRHVRYPRAYAFWPLTMARILEDCRNFLTTYRREIFTHPNLEDWVYVLYQAARDFWMARSGIDVFDQYGDRRGRYWFDEWPEPERGTLIFRASDFSQVFTYEGNDQIIRGHGA